MAHLSKLLALFDEPEGWHKANESRSEQDRGFKGLDHGGKPTVLDAIIILHALWSNNDKYTTEEGLRRCWRKAAILPVTWNADINNDLGSNSALVDETRISEELQDELCSLIGKLAMQTALMPFRP